MSKKEYVYIISDADAPFFKIGIATVCLNLRFNQLSRRYNFDLNRSYFVEMTNGYSRQLESLLHNIYDEYRHHRRYSNGALIEGGSEWFDKCVLNSTLYMIDRLAAGWERPYELGRKIICLRHWNDQPTPLDQYLLDTIGNPGKTIHAYDNKWGEIYDRHIIDLERMKKLFKARKEKTELEFLKDGPN